MNYIIKLLHYELEHSENEAREENKERLCDYLKRAVEQNELKCVINMEITDICQITYF